MPSSGIGVGCLLIVIVPLQRIASVLSQVVHFISDLLSSGSSLSGNKEGSVPLTYSASLLAVFLRSFSAPNRNARGSHSGHHHRLSPSPHHAMSESSSPTSHASITTLLGTLIVLLPLAYRH